MSSKCLVNLLYLFLHYHLGSDYEYSYHLRSDYYAFKVLNSWEADLQAFFLVSEE